MPSGLIATPSAEPGIVNAIDVYGGSSTEIPPLVPTYAREAESNAMPSVWNVEIEPGSVSDVNVGALKGAFIATSVLPDAMSAYPRLGATAMLLVPL